MHRFITLLMGIAVIFFITTSILNIYEELSEPILINGLAPPLTTHYGGIILVTGIKDFSYDSFNLKLNLTLEDIKRLKTPFIIQTKDNHLLSIEEFGEANDEDKVLLTDPYYGKVLLKETALKKIWNNSVLIIEKAICE